MIKRLLQSVMGIGKNTKHYNEMPVSPVAHSKLMDIAHEVLAKDALEKKLALSAFEKQGWPYLQRQRFTEVVRTKVRKLLRFSFKDGEENEMIEEITERIAEVAEVDPYVNRLFDDAEKKI